MLAKLVPLRPDSAIVLREVSSTRIIDACTHSMTSIGLSSDNYKLMAEVHL